jgi:hypothetical protein
MTDVVLGAELGAALELLIEAAERRALIAGDERARQEAAFAIGSVLVEEQPDQALHSREEDTAVLQDVLVVQRDRPRLPLADAATARLGPALPTAVRAFAKRAGIHSHLLRSNGTASLWLTELTIDGA